MIITEESFLEQVKVLEVKKSLHQEQGINIGNIYNRCVRNRNIKSKKILPQFKKVQVKKNGRIVREMNIRQRTRYPSGKGRVEY